MEKAITYVFAGRLIRNAEVRGSTPSAPPIESTTYGRAVTLPFLFSSVFGVTSWREADKLF